jgi:hypothetical protein
LQPDDPPAPQVDGRKHDKPTCFIHIIMLPY